MTMPSTVADVEARRNNDLGRCLLLDVPGARPARKMIRDIGLRKGHWSEREANYLLGLEPLWATFSAAPVPSETKELDHLCVRDWGRRGWGVSEFSSRTQDLGRQVRSWPNDERHLVKGVGLRYKLFTSRTDADHLLGPTDGPAFTRLAGSE
jgi:hypothetical protein